MLGVYAWAILGENESQANKRSQAVVNMDSLGFETVTSGIASASRNCFNKRNATK